MALSSIFGQIGNAANSIAPMAQGLGGLINAISGNRGVYKAYQQANATTPAEREYAILIDAISNPENARFRSMYDTQYKRGVDEFLKQLQMITQQSNRQLARGQRSAYFDPERMDERINYLTTRGLPGLQAQAETQAKNNLMTLANAQFNLMQPQKERQVANFALTQQKALDRQANPFGAFGDVLKALQGLAPKQDTNAFPWQQPGMPSPNGGTYVPVGAWNA